MTHRFRYSHRRPGARFAMAAAGLAILIAAYLFTALAQPQAAADGRAQHGRADDSGAGRTAPSAFAHGVGRCGDAATRISAVQGPGATSPMIGAAVVVEGIVVGDYQQAAGGGAAQAQLGGFFIQQEDADADADAATSEGLFIFDPTGTLDLSQGDRARVAGTVDEFAGRTQIDHVTAIRLCGSGYTVSPAVIRLPVPDSFASVAAYYERVEGMRVSFSDALTVTEQFELARFGQLVLSTAGRLRHYGQDGTPPLTQAGFERALAEQARRRILLDDFNSVQNRDPVFHPQPGGFSVTNFIRVGAVVQRLEGVLDFAFGEWRVQPLQEHPVRFDNPPRPAVPSLPGNLVVGSMNVLNYFNGDGLGGGFPTPRGAHSPGELQRQTDKLVAAITAMKPDILGLLEIENDGDGVNDALASLVHAINRVAGVGVYDYVRAGASGGTDLIKSSLIYQAATVAPTGAAQVLDTLAFTDPKRRGRQFNRPALAQAFQVVDSAHPGFNATFTAVLLHLKSKGSACGPGDDSTFAGNCNETRTQAATALLEWLASGPTHSAGNAGRADRDVLLLGDFNSYFQEAPLQVFYQAGYRNLLRSSDYSSVFGGTSAALDHALASPGLAGQIAGAAIWHINADENSLLDYNDTVRDDGEAHFDAKPPGNELYRPDAWRSSDHDPVLVGLDLSAPGE